MSVELEEIIPWGRNLAEYRRMFSLTAADLQKRILGCADGPASFNAELTAVNHSIISVDPIYAYSAAQIEQRVQETYPDMIAQVAQTEADYVWHHIRSPQQLAEVRLAAMNRFLADFEAGKADGRYQAHALPDLPFAAGTFDLALCSHFLFLYSEQLSLDFHVTAVAELMRVAGECRLFPLLDLKCRTSVHLQPVIQAMRQMGYQAAVETVDYEFQRGGDQMLRVSQKDDKRLLRIP